jgi:predicted nucleic acid-binding protein
VILLDTSGLLAAYDRDDQFHGGVTDTLKADERRILSPFVLAELDYLLATRAGQKAELQALRDVAGGAYELVAITDGDVAHCIDKMEAFEDLKIGLADASIMVLADRLDCLNVLTLDHHHFRAVVGPGGQAFHLFPEDK